MLAAAALLSSCVSDTEARQSAKFKKLETRASVVASDLAGVEGKIIETQDLLQSHLDEIDGDTLDEILNGIPQLETELESKETEAERLATERERLQAEVDTFKSTDPAFQTYLQGAFDAKVREVCDGAVTALFTNYFDYDVARKVVADAAFPDERFLDPARSVSDEAESCLNARNFDADVRAFCSTAVDAGQLAKNPSRFEGQCVHGYGYIVQYDTNTGPCTFHANIGSFRTSWYRYDVRVQFGTTKEPASQSIQTSCDWLDGAVADMQFEFWAIGVGSFSYSTSMGGTNTIPAFMLLMWRAT